MIDQQLGKLIFKINGWKYEVNPEALSDAKQVIIGFPHTTNLDTVRAAVFFHILNLNYHILVKKELFKFPLSPILKRLGFIPVDRAKSQNVVQQMADIFAQSDRFSLVIAPEATRGKDGEKRPIRTGFWHIAKASGVPIVLMLWDQSIETGRIFAKVFPSDSMEDDLKEIQRLYATYGTHIELPQKAS